MELQEPVAPMERDKLKRLKPQDKCTDAEHWDGPTRRSDESPVIGLEQRGRVRRSHERNSWKQDDPDACDEQIRSTSISAWGTKRVRRSPL